MNRHYTGSGYQKSDLSDEQLFSESMAEHSLGGRGDILDNVLSSQHPSTAQLAYAQAMAAHKSSTGTLQPYSTTQLPNANNQVGIIREDSYTAEQEVDQLGQIFSLEIVQATKPHDNINKKKSQQKGNAIQKQGGLFFDGLSTGIGSNLDFAGDKRPVRMKDVDHRHHLQ